MPVMGLMVLRNANGVVRASQLGLLKLRFFTVQPQYLSGLLTVMEWHQLEVAPRNPALPVSLFSANEPIGQKFTRLAEQPHNNRLPLRCGLLQLWASAVAGWLVSPDPAADGGNKLRDHFRELVGQMTEAELSECSLADLARQVHCSERHFSRLFREEFGVPFRARQIELRLQRARQLLAGSHAKLIFAQPVGSGGFATAYITNSPTIGFSDASGAASPYPATGNFVEENVCVQPFVICKSTATVGPVTNINNVTWEQLEYGVPAGRIPLSSWTGKITDTNAFVYLYERTKDSGTRRTETQGEYYQYNDPVTAYIYDYTNNFWYLPTMTAVTANGSSPNGVVGSEGAGQGNVNLNWGYGYIGGGDIKNSLNNGNAANQGIAYLSIADAKGVGTVNWNNVISYNGLWPTAAGAAIHGNTGTNDFSPITCGYYPLWGFEVLVFSTGTYPAGDQDITPQQLGDEFTPGTFMGVFNSQTLINGGSPLLGSIEKTIKDGESSGATAITLAEMVNARPAVGGTIIPPFQ